MINDETHPILGLHLADLELICSVIATYPEVEQAVIYGSRGRSTARYNSDIDIAIKGASASMNTAWSLRSRLDEDLALPYKFDVVHYDTLKSPELLANIDRDGKVLYRKTAL